MPVVNMQAYGRSCFTMIVNMDELALFDAQR